MTSTKTVTVDQLITDYAKTIGDETGLDPADYDRDAAGLASLLHDAADGIGGHVAEWLEEAAADLTAIVRLGDDGPKTQNLLKKIRGALYEVEADLA